MIVGDSIGGQNTRLNVFLDTLETLVFRHVELYTET